MFNEKVKPGREVAWQNDFSNLETLAFGKNICTVLHEAASVVGTWLNRGYLLEFCCKNCCYVAYIVSYGSNMKNYNKMHAQRLHNLRKELGMSQREFAKEFRVSHGAVALWESGERNLSGPVSKLLEIYEMKLKNNLIKNAEIYDHRTI